MDAEKPTNPRYRVNIGIILPLQLNHAHEEWHVSAARGMVWKCPELPVTAFETETNRPKQTHSANVKSTFTASLIPGIFPLTIVGVVTFFAAQALQSQQALSCRAL